MCIFISRLHPGTGCLLDRSSAFHLLWTLAPCDYVTYCQARGISGHSSPCGECVCFNLDNSTPPEVEEDSLLSRGWTLSGHTWSTARKFSILSLNSLHPYGKPNLGYATRRWFTLLGDGSCCSATAHNCSATHHGGRTMSLTARLCSHLLGQAQDGVAQRIQGARGLAVGGTTPDTHGRPYGLRSQGRPSPQDEALQGMTLLGVSRKTPGRYPEDTTRSVRICSIP